MTWNRAVEKDMRECGLNKAVVQDRVKWRRPMWEPKVVVRCQMAINELLLSCTDLVIYITLFHLI